MRSSDTPQTEHKPDPAFFARILAGREATERGDLAEAEAIFLSLLETTRGAGDGNERWAIRSLITFYGRSGRLFEALILARRLQTFPGAEPMERAFAQAAICNVLNALGLEERLADALADMERLLPDLPEAPRRDLRKEFISSAIGHAFKANDIERARSLHEEFRQIMADEGETDPLDDWLLGINGAAIAYEDGDPERACAIFQALEDDGAIVEMRRMQTHKLWAEACLALGRRDEAAAHAAKAFARLEAIQDEPEQCGNRIQHGHWLAEFYETAMRSPERAHRAHDLLAAAIVLRMAQLESVVARVPEFGLTEEPRELAEYRKAFLKEQTELLGRVAKLIESDSALRRGLSRDLPEGYIAVCAWCERVRPEEGTWLPIGHYVPRHVGLRLTHGICPPCANNLAAPS